MTDREELRHLKDRDRDRHFRKELVEWHGISVVRYADGTNKATHATLDAFSRRVKFESLRDPEADTIDLPWHIVALTNAAAELEVDHRGRLGLW